MIGWLDIHIHGQGGFDCMGSEQDLLGLSLLLKRQGVSAFLPTFVSASPSRIRVCLETVKRVSGQERGARILGVHLEGPFLNPSKRGAHRRSRLRPPSVREAREWIAAGEGLVRLVTLAPEMPDALPLVRFLRRQGVRVSLGHSACTFAQARGARRAGASSVTHLFNAMGVLHHREPGLAGYALSDDGIYTEIIADGHHVSRPMLELVLRTRPPEKIVLVSDSLPCSKTGRRRSLLEGRPVFRRPDGTLRTQDGALAGSNITLGEAVRFVKSLGVVSARQAEAMATVNPMRMLGLK